MIYIIHILLSLKDFFCSDLIITQINTINLPMIAKENDPSYRKYCQIGLAQFIKHPNQAPSPLVKHLHQTNYVRFIFQSVA